MTHDRENGLVHEEGRAELTQALFELEAERIREIAKAGEDCGGMAAEPEVAPQFAPYFKTTASYISLLLEEWDRQAEMPFSKETLAGLRSRNRALYEDILPQQYACCYGNPAYTAALYGEEPGRILAFLYSEMHSQIESVYERDMEAFTMRMELFLLLYQEFTAAFQDGGGIPDGGELRRTIYEFVLHYMPETVRARIRSQLDPKKDFLLNIVMESELSDIRYLYRYGEYITTQEEQLAAYLNELPEETIGKMADTFTEGYRLGFVAGGKDITKKKTVNIRYVAGFERVIRGAVENFRKMGLEPVIYRASDSVFHKRGTARIGFYGAEPNRQFAYDHREDEALYLDRKFISRKREVLEEAYEAMKELAAVHGGPACLEAFGEEPFAPVARPEALHFNSAQQQLSVEYAAAAGELVNRYIKGEERSYTIIAFPVPAIGPLFAEIFDAVISINTLDYHLYQRIQQTIIDAMDGAAFVRIKGKDGNRTDMKVMLHPLQEPEKETAFENCVADVNIPVGEVFTSPKLEGTEGVLHVTRVFLNGLEYRDLELRFAEGRVTAYRCGNFPSEEEGRDYIRDNVLFHHESLPLGEFAIGTNTTAYAAARKYEIGERLPILIAEKTGPHFAVGDTCYSHSEELAVYNPDGKEVVARDNSQSLKRREKAADAYYNCHTDITIPYDELGEVTAVFEDGREQQIFAEGRFVLPGCEELNLPLKMY